MKSNAEIIQGINDYRENMQKFDFSATQKLTDYSLLSSALDVYGVVLLKDNRVFRGVYPKSKEKFVELYNTGILQVLAKEGFIPDFHVTDFYTDDYPLIIEVDKLDILHFRDYSYSMIKEEAKLKLRLMEILSEFGYTLIDGHTGNTTFRNGSPIFFDLGSFIKNERNGNADYEVWKYNIVPLIMLSLGKFMSARGIYYGFPNPWLIPNIALKDSKEVKDAISEFLELVNVDETLKEKVRNFQTLNSNDLDVLFPPENYAMNVEQKKVFSNLEEISANNDNIYDIVIDKICKNVSNGTVLHLGCSTGRFVDKCIKTGNFKTVFGMDNNEFVIDYAVNKVKGGQFVFCNAIVGGPTLPVKADAVYASGLVFDMLAKKKFDIVHVLRNIRMYVNKFLYIEFFPYGKNKSTCSKDAVPNHYTIDWFEKRLSEYFEINNKEVLDTVQMNEQEEPFRILYETKILN